MVPPQSFQPVFYKVLFSAKIVQRISITPPSVGSLDTKLHTDSMTVYV